MPLNIFQTKHNQNNVFMYLCIKHQTWQLKATILKYILPSKAAPLQNIAACANNIFNNIQMAPCK